MVQANRANRNTKIQTPLSCPRQPEDRGSMHPSRPREADWVARWLSGQRGARRARGGWAGACGAARLARGISRRRPALRSRAAPATTDRAESRQTRRRERAAEAKSTTGVVKDHAQRFLVRIDDVVDEPLARRRMEHQKNHRPLRPIIQRHFRHNAVRPIHFRRNGLDPAAILLARQRIGVEYRKVLVVLHRRRPRLVEGRRKVSAHERRRRVVEDRTPTAIVIQRSQRLDRFQSERCRRPMRDRTTWSKPEGTELSASQNLSLDYVIMTAGLGRVPTP